MALLLGPHNKVTALSAQIGYAMNLKSVLQLKTKIKKNMILWHVGNTQNETTTINNSPIWLLSGKLFDTKDITRVVFPAYLLANVLTNKTKQHGKIHNSINLNN